MSARENVELWIARLEAVHARTNCVAAWNTAALETAAHLDARRSRGEPIGPLHGIPFTAKDWIDTNDLPCTGGTVEARERRPRADATVVARMRAAGAVLLAKTTVQPESELFGRVSNPHDAARSPGGSSSGEAAAVGGCGSPCGVGSDSGGSIRLPAAWCGAAGIKPTAGRVPNTGHFPRVGERSDGRTQIGPIAASVDDLATILMVIAGPDGEDAGVAPVALGSHLDVDMAQVRVGWCSGEGNWQPSPEQAVTLRRGVEIVEDAGAILAGEITQHLGDALDITRRYWARKGGNDEGAEQQMWDWDRFRRRALIAMRDVDAIVMPTTPATAPLHRAMEDVDYIFTLPASLTGMPAVTVPVTQADGALPRSVQVVARPWRDDIALAVAAALERGFGAAVR